jgi:SprT-like protein
VYARVVAEAVVLTRGQLERDGWPAMAATIRHELVHVHLIGEYGAASHGDRFTEAYRCGDCGGRFRVERNE